MPRDPGLRAEAGRGHCRGDHCCRRDFDHRGGRVVVTRRDGATGAAHAFEINVDMVLSGEGSGLELAGGDV